MLFNQSENILAYSSIVNILFAIVIHYNTAPCEVDDQAGRAVLWIVFLSYAKASMSTWAVRMRKNIVKGYTVV